MSFNSMVKSNKTALQDPLVQMRHRLSYRFQPNVIVINVPSFHELSLTGISYQVKSDVNQSYFLGHFQPSFLYIY